jgi:hypothetical protein
MLGLPIFSNLQSLARCAFCAGHEISFLQFQAEEYEKLGSYALIGLPDDLYPER